MILGTHNSISYLKPKKWWMRLINFTAKCQSMTIEEQWEYGVRYFDLRIGDSMEGECMSHGLVKYKGNLEDILLYLNNCAKLHNEKCFVAINLEEYVYDIHECKSYIDYFEEKLKSLQSEYTSLTICGGYCKGPWRKIISYIENPTLFEKYWEFCNYKWQENKFKAFITNLFHFCPKYWAKRNNKAYKDEFKSDTRSSVLLLDFVQL